MSPVFLLVFSPTEEVMQGWFHQKGVINNDFDSLTLIPWTKLLANDHNKTHKSKIASPNHPILSQLCYVTEERRLSSTEQANPLTTKT